MTGELGEEVKQVPESTPVNSLHHNLEAKFRAAWEATRSNGLVDTVNLALTAVYFPETIPDEVAAKCTYGDNREILKKPINELPENSVEVDKNQLKELKGRIWNKLRNGDYSGILIEGAADFFKTLSEKYPDTVVSIWTESQAGRRLEQMAKINSLPVGHETFSTAAQNESFGGINIVAVEKSSETNKVEWLVNKLTQDKEKREIMIIDDKLKVIEKVIQRLDGKTDLSKIKFIHLLQGRANSTGDTTSKYPSQVHQLNNLSELVELMKRGEFGKPAFLAVDLDDTLTDDNKRIDLQAKMFADVITEKDRTN